MFFVEHYYKIFKIEEAQFNTKLIGLSSLWWFWVFFVALIITDKKTFFFESNVQYRAKLTKPKKIIVTIAGLFICYYVGWIAYQYGLDIRTLSQKSRALSHEYFYSVVYVPFKLEVYLSVLFGILILVNSEKIKLRWLAAVVPFLLLEFASAGRTLTFQILVFVWFILAILTKKSHVNWLLLGLVLIILRTISRLGFKDKDILTITSDFVTSVGGEFAFTKISTLLSLNSNRHGQGGEYLINNLLKIFPPMTGLGGSTVPYEIEIFKYFPKTIWFGIGGSPISESYYYFGIMGIILSPLVVSLYFYFLILLQRLGFWWVLYLYLLHLSYMVNFFRHGFYDLIFNNIHTFFYFILPMVLLGNKRD